MRGLGGAAPRYAGCPGGAALSYFRGSGGRNSPVLQWVRGAQPPGLQGSGGRSPPLLQEVHGAQPPAQKKIMFYAHNELPTYWLWSNTDCPTRAYESHVIAVVSEGYDTFHQGALR